MCTPIDSVRKDEGSNLLGEVRGGGRPRPQPWDVKAGRKLIGRETLNVTQTGVFGVLTCRWLRRGLVRDASGLMDFVFVRGFRGQQRTPFLNQSVG